MINSKEVITETLMSKLYVEEQSMSSVMMGLDGISEMLIAEIESLQTIIQVQVSDETISS